MRDVEIYQRHSVRLPKIRDHYSSAITAGLPRTLGNTCHFSNLYKLSCRCNLVVKRRKLSMP